MNDQFKLPKYLVGTSFETWILDNERERGEELLPEIYLPRFWNPKDKNNHLELSNQNLRVSYIGPGKCDEDVGAIRANHHIPPQCGLYYFEIEIKSKGREGLIGIGFCGKNVKLNRQPGWELNSWGYHGDDGHSFCCSGNGSPYGPTFTTNDVIGCGINFRTNTAFYTKNGMNLGTAFRDIKGELFPCIGLRTKDEKVETNFGQEPFHFDIAHYMKEEKLDLWNQINLETLSIHVPSPIGHRFEAGELNSKKDQTRPIVNLLITSYLVHHGYTQTAKMFAQNAIGYTPDSSTFEDNGDSLDLKTLVENKIREELDSDNENDVQNRKRIRDYVIEGNIDEAMELTQQYFKDVLDTASDVKFQLQCQKFVELMRRKETESNTNSTDLDNQITSPKSNGNGNLEIAEKRKRSSQPNPTDKDALGFSDALMEEVLNYGKLLHDTYGNSDNLEIQKGLETTFALMAYPDISQSSLAYLLDPARREPLANLLNSAILTSQGRPSNPGLEVVFRQACNVTKHMVDNAIGEGAFINVHKDCLL